jgi:hypothetical protein
MVTHLPSVPSAQSRMWSIAALAAEAALDRPRASMIAAPRLPTCGMNVLAFQSASLIQSLSDAAADRGEAVVRVHGRASGCPTPPCFSMSATATPALLASCDSARLWSRRSIA